jgi:ATP-dependent exoDNAse (exonuclease V) beta subunit
MTRATKQLVIISNELSKTSREKLLTEEKFGKYDFACLLEAVLGQNNKSPVKYDLAGANKAELVWSSGSVEWIDRINPPIVEPAITLKRDTSKFIAVSRVQKNQPSKIAKVSKNKKQPKSDQAYGKEFGTLVHSLFESLEWDTKTFSADINKKTIGLPENSYLTQAVRIIEQCLKSADIIKLLEDNSQNKILWKEKQAVIMYEGKMIDAVFDRVHIIPGTEATIIDYKTNFDFSDDELEIEYKVQMNLYRISVSELTGIPVDKIKCVLINVRRASSKYVKF